MLIRVLLVDPIPITLFESYCIQFWWDLEIEMAKRAQEESSTAAVVVVVIYLFYSTSISKEALKGIDEEYFRSFLHG